MGKYLRIVAAISLIAIIFKLYNSNPASSYYKQGYQWEVYDSTLAVRLQSVEALLHYADSLNNFGERASIEYAEFLAAIIRKRFYHGYSHYTYSNNWIATLAGKYIWTDLSAIVLPNDILKHPMAACSQQSIVLMQCFKKVGIDYRKVGFQGHFALEGKIKGHWYYFDTDMEPHFVNKRKSLTELISTNELLPSYKASDLSQTFKESLLHPNFGRVNKPPAPNAAFFHHVTYFFSWLLLFVPIFFILLPLLKKRKTNEVPIKQKRFSNNLTA